MTAARRFESSVVVALAIVAFAPRADAQDATSDTQPGAQRIGDPTQNVNTRTIKPPRLVKFVEADYPEFHPQKRGRGF